MDKKLLTLLSVVVDFVYFIKFIFNYKLTKNTGNLLYFLLLKNMSSWFL